MKKPHRWIAGSKASKHVVFLGAGASLSSGYPLANELTLLMCDPPTFRKKLCEVFEADGDGPKHFERDSVIVDYVLKHRAANLLRESDFSTMDELSKHVAGGGHADKIRELKKIMRLMLALQNPDISHYAESDYRSLIQKLFVNGSLRNDVTLISYNYDPYLDFRLFRSYTTRRATQEANPNDNRSLQAVGQAIYSGFLKPDELNWLQEGGFCHLKLHGTCAFPAESEVGNAPLSFPPQSNQRFHAGYLFAKVRAILRLASLVQSPFVDQDLPSILPWEIIHEKEVRLLTNSEFNVTVGEGWQHASLYPLFQGIWERARREVQRADKISFVGLSFGQYLEPGLCYLFNGKSSDIQLIIANPQNQRFQHYEGPPHPNSPAGRAIEVLKDRCGMRGEISASFSEFAGFDPEAFEAKKTGEIRQPAVTCHNSFREFIDAEL